MSEIPEFTVIIPTHNYGHYLATAIDSVLAQDRSGVEVLIVDDASEDQTPEVVAEYGDLVTYRRLHDNVGPAGAWAVGIDHARGRLVAKLDADDWYLPGHLDAVSKAFDSNPEAGMVVSPVYLYYEDEGTAAASSVGAPTGTLSADVFRRHLLRRFFFFMPGVALRRAALVGHEGPRSSLWMAHDWEFLIRTMSGWDCVILGEPTAVYRIHSTSVTRSKDQSSRRQQDLTHLLELASESASPLVSNQREKAIFALGLAETYLRVTPLRESLLDLRGTATNLAYAWSLARLGGAPLGFLSVLARVGVTKTRSLLRLRGRRRTPAEVLMPRSNEQTNPRGDK